jgi:hypothetical protein
MWLRPDIFLAAISSSTELGNTRPSGPRPESVAKIHEVGFYSLTSSTWDNLSLYDAAPSPTVAEQADTFLRDSYSGQNSPNSLFEHPCMPLTKIISAGTFYYALEPYWDLSSRLSQRITRDGQALPDVGRYDDRFVWNEYIVRSLLDFRERLDPMERSDLDRCQFIVSVDYVLSAPAHLGCKVLAIQGYVGIHTLPLPAPPTNGKPMVATVSLISRLGWKRAGTRFNTRGVDDDGNCANFVEVCPVQRNVAIHPLICSRPKQSSARR